MKKFKFRFSKLLELKRRREDLLKENLAKIDMAISRKKTKLITLNKRSQRLQGQLRYVYSGPVTIDAILIHQRSISHLKGEIQREEKALEVLLQERKEVSDQVLAAMKERKILEKLKEKRYAQFRTEVSKIEQKVTDEVAATRYFKLQNL